MDETYNKALSNICGRGYAVNQAKLWLDSAEPRQIEQLANAETAIEIQRIKGEILVLWKAAQ